MNEKWNMRNLLSCIDKLYVGKFLFLEHVEKGFLSKNIILKSGNIKYFLKKYRFDNEERIKEIHSVKKYFSDRGIPVILPIFTKDKKTYFSFGNDFYALFPFVYHKQFERGALNNSAIVSLGKMLGRIHLVGREADVLIKEKFKTWNREKILEKIALIENEIEKVSTLTDFDKIALESIKTKRRLVLLNHLGFENFNLPCDHLVHGDYLDHNVFFDVENNVSFVFDFEKTEYCPRTQELFRSMLYSLSGNFQEEDFEKMRLYLKSYSKIYPISKEELTEGLKMFFIRAMHNAWVESEHYLKNNNRVDIFLKMDNDRLQYFSQYYEDFEKRIFSSFLQ